MKAIEIKKYAGNKVRVVVVSCFDHMCNRITLGCVSVRLHL